VPAVIKNSVFLACQAVCTNDDKGKKE